MAMKQIEFLPQRYREQAARRQANVWRLTVLLMLGGVVATASLGQFAHRRRVQHQLALVQPLYADAQAAAAQLAQRQTELNAANADATLCALVQTAPPLSDVLATVAQAVDGSITIEQLQLHSAAEGDSARRSSDDEAHAPAGEPSGAPTSAGPRHDLADVRRLLADLPAHAQLVGLTSDIAALHAFLERLAGTPRIARAELLSIESVADGTAQGRSRFTAQLQLRPPSPTPGQVSPPAVSAAPSLPGDAKITSATTAPSPNREEIARSP